MISSDGCRMVLKNAMGRFRLYALCGLAILSFQARPQQSEVDLKVAYTLNFAKFTHWSQGAAEEHIFDLRLCVTGLTPVTKAFQEADGKRVGNKLLWVDLVRLPGNVGDCHVLFLSDWDTQNRPFLLEGLGQSRILTVGDAKGFACAGGMIELVLVDQRLRFEINLDAVNRAGLRLDPKLLHLAVRIHGNKIQGP